MVNIILKAIRNWLIDKLTSEEIHGITGGFQRWCLRMHKDLKWGMVKNLSLKQLAQGDS